MSGATLRDQATRPVPPVPESDRAGAGCQDRWSAVAETAVTLPLSPLPTVSEVAALSPRQIPAVLVQLAALQAAAATRLLAVLPADTAPMEPFVTARVVASELSLAPDTVYELARTGQIPSVPVGTRGVRFSLPDVRAALKAGTAVATPVSPKRRNRRAA